MSLMPPYLATCHVLAHLESPLTVEDFMLKMVYNPFFKQDCVGPPLFLKNLTGLGLLTFQDAHYQLSVEGKAFEQHILQWNAHDPKVKAARVLREQQETQQPALKQRRASSVCPACGQKYCALYVFILLYSRFLEGQPHRDFFEELRQMGGSPEAYFEALDLPFRQFFYWDRSLSLADCSAPEKNFLASQLPVAVWLRLEERLEKPVPIDVSLQSLAAVDYQQLPYFQGTYRLLSRDLLKQIQALRYPVLAPYLDPEAPDQLGLLHLGPIVIDAREKRCWSVLRCNAHLKIYTLDYTLKAGFKVVSVKKACYTEQEYE
jgi:hypothetical protein